jgi:hypothetical protein
MKKLLWTSAIALTAAACMTACDDSSSGASNSIPEFKTEAALPDTCEMEVAKAGDTYFACFENKWIEVTDSATVEQFKEGLDEDEIKAKLEELEDQLKPTTPAKPKSSSSKKTPSLAITQSPSCHDIKFLNFFNLLQHIKIQRFFNLLTCI